MGSRRRNLFVILFVLGLLAGSTAIMLSKPTRLGLDLSGGTRLVYQGQPTQQQPEVTPEDVDRAITIVRERVDRLGVAEPEIARVGTDQLQIDLPEVQNTDRAISQVGETAQLQFYDWEDNVLIPPDQGGDGDPVSPEQWDQQARFVQLYEAVKFASTREPECVEDRCTTTGPTFYLFDKNERPISGPEPVREDLFLDTDERRPKGSELVAVPQGTVVVEAARDVAEDAAIEPPPDFYVLRDRPELSGDDLRDPQQEFDPTTNQPNVTFDFSDKGRNAFQEVTRRIAQRGLAQAPPGISSGQSGGFSGRFAIVLDGEVVSRPIIDFIENPDGIDGRTGAQISGNFTIQEAQDLATFLQIGALPINLKLISQSTVSATLGQDALDAGLTAGIAGLILVLLLLVVVYRFLGVVAGLGLITYAALFFAMIKLIPVTLTLPGIAGLVLTIGIAADSNIVIFERIKEEVRAGKSLLSAITSGYRHGIATIIDANVIILLTAFILFGLATAGVKGFAFTLGVGTIVALFTAVVFTQAVLGSLGRARFMSSPALLGAGTQRFKWDFDFSGASRWFFSMSGAILLIGGVSLGISQINFGIDFESGSRIKTSLSEGASVGEVRDALADANVDGAESAKIQILEEPDFGANVVGIQIAELEPEDVGKLQTALDRSFGIEEEGFDSTLVGPTFGDQVARSAVYAVLFSLLLISAYVAFRFEPKYAVPVMIALIHDLLITAGVYSLSDREMTSATVAALLTILGLSLYDTVIVFDRIRENVPRFPRAAFSQIANRSLSEVLTRSLVTSATTLAVIVMILVFGGETLGDFAFAMLIGIASGFYSSIFIATPVLIHWKEREPSYRARARRIAEAMGKVPAFPEDNIVAKIDEAERHVTQAPAPAAVAAEPEPVVGEIPRGAAEVEPGEPEPGRPDEPAGGEPTPAKSDKKQKRRRQDRKRRKHGRAR